MKQVKLTLHNGEEILVNWDCVAFATPSTNESTREVYTKIVFNTNGGEVDVRETVEDISLSLSTVTMGQAVEEKDNKSKAKVPRRK
jgi:hypothetical protein